MFMSFVDFLKHIKNQNPTQTSNFFHASFEKCLNPCLRVDGIYSALSIFLESIRFDRSWCSVMLLTTKLSIYSAAIYSI